MKSTRIASRFAVAWMCVMFLSAHARGNDSEGFIDLFASGDLSGWVVEGMKFYVDGDERKPVWTIQDGVVRRNSSNRSFGFLRYDRKVCDFEFHLEYRMSEGCNSGIGIRGVVFTGLRKTRPSLAGYEIQILDDAQSEATKHSSASLYRYVAPSKNATKPHGEWNVMDIRCVGPMIQVTHNGQVVHDIDQSQIEAIKDKPLCGYVSLQDHGHAIEFRNVRLKELSAAR